VNSREIDGRVLTLAPSGWVYVSTFVLYDYETESMWYPVEENDGNERFLGISGEFAGRKLEYLPGRLIAWSDWVARHPGSKLLK